ncbi:hypothetical protein ACGVWS_11955 [Enterobacteriaceae bacterium LUAb1]
MAKNDTYVIGCKLPHGLSFRHGGSVITLAGANSSRLINGFGLTKDVPVEAWEFFSKAHKETGFIKNGLIFAVSDEKSAEDASIDHEKQKTGLERKSAKEAGVKEDKEDEDKEG